MALDDLLAKLEIVPALRNPGVSEVSEVQASNVAGSGCNPCEIGEVSEVSTGGVSVKPTTPDTSENTEGYQRKPASMQGCTLDTPDTPQTDNAQGLTARAWMMHFSDRDPMEVRTAPPATHDEILALYPDAVAAVPITDHTSTRSASTSERNELLALLEVIYADDTEADKQEAIGLALADPEGALTCCRAIAAERGLSVSMPVSMPVSTEPAPAHLCRTCRHRTAPGRADPGYCDQRADLPKAYGEHHPLHQLPADGGTDCPKWAPHE